MLFQFAQRTIDVFLPVAENKDAVARKESIHTEARQLRQETTRKLLRLVPVHDVGRDLLVSELADGTSDHHFGFGRTNVHGRLRLYHMDPPAPPRGLTASRLPPTMAIVVGRIATVVGLSLVCVVGSSVPASADVTIFGGTVRAGESRSVVGGALGLGIALFGLEFEYANARGNAERGLPSLQTGMFNVMLRTPELGRFRAYGTVSGGMYRERIGGARFVPLIERTER